MGISVASAGDNTFAMLLKNPRRIYAFDVNPTQLFCCELKMACFRCLTHREMLVLLGVCEGDRISLYRTIRHTLSKEARCFFDSNSDIIRYGVIHAGKFERYFGIFRRYVLPLIASRKRFHQFISFAHLADQLQFYQRYINNRRLNAIFRIYFGYKVMGKLGRDSSFYDYVAEKEQSGGDIRRRFEYGISHTLNADNPYCNYIIGGNYSNRSLPLYLQRKYFERIRSRIDRIVLVRGDLLSLDAGNVDFANLSDIFEYMSDSEFEQNVDRLSDMLNLNGRAAYWNMQNRRYINNPDFSFDRVLSQRLFSQNHSWFYRDFLLYRRVQTNE